MKMLFIFANASLSNRVRTNKICHILNSRGWDIAHWAWVRKTGEDVETFDFPVGKRVLLRRGGYASAATKLLYIVWMLKVFLNSWTIPKTTKVWALGFESAFPLLLGSWVKGYQIIFDDADRFSMVFGFPVAIKRALQSCEKFTSRHVLLHLIPNRSRYEFESGRFYELKNMPSERDVKAAQIFSIEHVPNFSGVTVYVNGLLEKTRGIDTILVVAKRLLIAHNKSVRFLVAGPVRGIEAEEFIALENVVYLGRINNDAALALYRKSDFVLTYYDPAIEINQLAEANKWGDALKMGAVPIINTEVITADFITSKRCAVSYPYHDSSGLYTELTGMDRLAIDELKERVRALGATYPFFEDAIATAIEQIEHA